MSSLQRIGRLVYQELAAQVMGPQDEGIGALADLAMRMRRSRCQVHMGAAGGYPIIMTEHDFRQFATSHLKALLTRSFVERRFHLLTMQFENIEKWEGMRLMNTALQVHGSYAKVTTSRDVYLINGLDFFLCDLDICLS